MWQPTCSFDLSHSNRLEDNPNFGAAESVSESKKGSWISGLD